MACKSLVGHSAVSLSKRVNTTTISWIWLLGRKCALRRSESWARSLLYSRLIPACGITSYLVNGAETVKNISTSPILMQNISWWRFGIIVYLWKLNHLLSVWLLFIYACLLSNICLWRGILCGSINFKSLPVFFWSIILRKSKKKCLKMYIVYLIIIL